MAGLGNYLSPQIGGFIDKRRNALAGLGAGLLQGQPGAGVQAGLQADDAYATQQKAEAERQKAIADQTALRAKYAQQFIAWGKPEVAQAITDGIKDPGEAYWEHVSPKPAEPFTLGEGQTRFSGDGKTTIAQGNPSTPDTLVTTNIGGTDKFYDTLDAKLAEQTAGLIDGGISAQSNNMRLSQLEQTLATAPQGFEGAWKSLAGELGIPTEGLDEIQSATALINSMVPEQRPPGSGPMSDRDVLLFKASLPRIINQPGGNARIIQTAKAINEYYIAQATIAQQVANREISPAEGRKLQAAVPNPLANFNAGTGTAGASPVIDLGNGVTIQEIP